MKAVKWLSFCTVFLIVLIFLIGFLFKMSSSKYIKKEIGIDISSCEIIKDLDTHGGCMGDGSYLLVADCEKVRGDILQQMSNWKKFPLSENLQLEIYGGEKDGVTFASNDYASIPKIENGYYYFYNRHHEAKSAFSDEDLFDNFSYNYTVSFYDEDTNFFYYFEMDT